MILPDESKAGGRVPLRWILRLATTLLALALLLWWLPVDDLWAAARSVPLVVWPMAVAAYLSVHLIGVVKWRLLVNAAGAGLGTRQAVQSYYWGLFGNLYLPSLVGGDVVRAGVAMRHVRSKSALLLGSLVDRVQDVIGLFALATAGAILAPRALDDTSRRIGFWLLVLLGTGAIGAVILFRFFPVARVPFRVRRLLVRIRQAVRSTAARPGVLIKAFAIGVALQSSLILLNWQLGRLIGIDVAPHVWFFVWPLAKLAGLIPLTQGGIGVREIAQAALFVPFGVSAVQAVATGFVFEVVIITGGLIAGGVALLTRPNLPRPRADSTESLAGRTR